MKNDRRELNARVRWACEEFLAILKELASIHSVVDRPDGRELADDVELQMRLRKSLFHVRSITISRLDSDALHSTAPDIRSARRQLAPLVREHLYNAGKRRGFRQYDRQWASLDARLAPVCHPSPEVLVFLMVPESQRRTVIDSHVGLLSVLLGLLATDYALALGVLADALAPSKSADILSVFDRINAALPRLRVDCVLRQVPENELDSEDD